MRAGLEKYGVLLTAAVNSGRIASKPVESLCIQTGTSVLLTVVNGYGMVSQRLGVNTHVMADELTEMIWNKVSSPD